MSTLNGPIWSRCTSAPTNPARSHFQRTLNKERRGQGRDERCHSSGEGKEQEDEDGQEKRQQKREDRRLISKRLRAALLRSFRRQHGEKMVLGECPE